MNIDETTLIELEDYIRHLDETVGLKAETMLDFDRAIAKKRKELKNLTQAAVTPPLPSRCCGRCDGINDEV